MSSSKMGPEVTAEAGALTMKALVARGAPGEPSASRQSMPFPRRENVTWLNSNYHLTQGRLGEWSAHSLRQPQRVRPAPASLLRQASLCEGVMESSSLPVLEAKEVENGTVLRRTRRNLRSLFSLNRKREFETLCNMLDLAPSDFLLDVGSGDGYWIERFASRVGRATGLEPDDALLNHARRFHCGANLQYEDGVAEALPFAAGTFDKVVAVSSLEHFGDPYKALQEMFRV